MRPNAMMRAKMVLMLMCLAALALAIGACDPPEMTKLPSRQYTAVLAPSGVITVPAGRPGSLCEFDGTVGHAQLDGTTWFQVIATRPVDLWIPLYCDGMPDLLVHVIEPPKGA